MKKKTPIGNLTSVDQIGSELKNAAQSKLATLSFEEHQEFLNLSTKISAYALIAQIHGNNAPIIEATKNWPQKYKDIIL